MEDIDLYCYESLDGENIHVAQKKPVRRFFILPQLPVTTSTLAPVSESESEEELDDDELSQ